MGARGAVTLSLARRRPGRYVPLEEQDPGSWDARLVDEGETYLRRAAASGGAPGRFELEAAIQAVHLDRRRTGTTDWSALRQLYTALVAVAPSLGSRVALAAVIGRADGPRRRGSPRCRPAATTSSRGGPPAQTCSPAPGVRPRHPSPTNVRSS